jgi:hypothetical protein
MRKVEDMNTIDMADLKRRVDENVAALYAGGDLPHQFTEEESLALRPQKSGGFGIQPDGRIVHCGTALFDKTELDIDLWNDQMRIEAGFLPENSSEEFRAKVRADIPRRRKEHEELVARVRKLSSAPLIMGSRDGTSMQSWLFLLVGIVAVVAAWLFFQR